MRLRALELGGLLGAVLFALAGPAYGASKNVELVDNLPEAKNATAINFLQYKDAGDVMLVTGRFGLKSYSLEDPADPVLLDEVTAEDLRLEGDPEVDFDASPPSTFWQNEDMDVDRQRKLVLLSRDPRAYAGSTTREPGETDPNGATNIAGVYVINARNPERLRLSSFQQLPTGHTTTCVNRCQALWTGGPASTTTQQATLGWTFGRPIIVTDLSDPEDPHAFPMEPVDLFRRDGVTAYSHDVQVDDAGIAWVSGDGGTRGYWTKGRHYDPLEGRERPATALKPIPYGGGGLPASVTADQTGGVSTTRGGRSEALHRREIRAMPPASSCWRPRRTSDPPRRHARTAGSSRSPHWRGASTARRGARRHRARSASGWWAPGARTGRRAHGR